MLPGFSAALSLYRSRQVNRSYGAAPAADVAQLAGTLEMVIPANGTVPGSSCDAYTHCPPGSMCCQRVSQGGIPFAECADLQSDADNCGSCLNQCRSVVCCGGECIAQRDDSCGCPARPCSPDHKCCIVFVGGEEVHRCVNVNDGENCGSCGHRCASGQACCDGTCCSGSCCGGKCCSKFAKCVNDRCCYPESVIAVVAALICLLTLGSDGDAIYQQLQSQACP
jgi:hypothetical protein